MKNKTDFDFKEKNIIRKGKKGILKIVFSRFGLIFLFLIAQIAVLFAMVYGFHSSIVQYFGFNIAFSVVVSLLLINSTIDPTAKITWLCVIALFPLFGSLLFAYTQSDIGHRALKKRTEIINKTTANKIVQNDDVIKRFKYADGGACAMSKYVSTCGCYPVFDNTDTKYFDCGEAMHAELLANLKKAEKYIFLEFFIIADGEMWQSVLDILAEKAKSGVDVRVMYDGTCEFSTMPHNYPHTLKQMGIKCKMFAPITPFLSTHYNYRDHRKIVVIDGHTAFTGGINLADEYINKIHPYGHWKDSGVMVRGNAAQSFALMFIQMWAIDEKHADFQLEYVDTHATYKDSGFIMPYSDCPLDNEKVGERVYVDILNRAKDYIFIMTPYMILDSVMENAINYAAERGVDVRIVLPGVPDKKIPYALAKTHYKALLNSGVKIYEYTPGFVHSKTLVCDDTEAVVGTINLDYRSLYHHFECAAYMNRCTCIHDIKEDFEKTFEASEMITKDSVNNESWIYKFIGFMFKIFAPLL